MLPYVFSDSDLFERRWPVKRHTFRNRKSAATTSLFRVGLPDGSCIVNKSTVHVTPECLLANFLFLFWLECKWKLYGSHRPSLKGDLAIKTFLSCFAFLSNWHAFMSIYVKKYSCVVFIGLFWRIFLLIILFLLVLKGPEDQQMPSIWSLKRWLHRIAQSGTLDSL